MLETEPSRLFERVLPRRHTAGHHDHVGPPFVISRRGFSGACQLQLLLRPALERGASRVRQHVDAALGTVEPAIDIVQQDFAGIGDMLAQIAHALRSFDNAEAQASACCR